MQCYNVTEMHSEALCANKAQNSDKIVYSSLNKMC